MRAAAGGDFWCKGVYQEIVVPERIVYLSYFTDADGKIVPPSHYGINNGHPLESIAAVTFENLNGKTKFELRYSMPENFPDLEEMRKGLNQMFDKLARSF